MKIVFCWSNISGYMASCWRELANRPGVDLHVIAYADSNETAFNHELMRDIAWTPLPRTRQSDTKFIQDTVSAHQPDIVVIAGWLNSSYTSLPRALAPGPIKWIMGMDTPWKGGLRQHLARFALSSYLAKLDAIVVAGERSWQYARRLGVPLDRIQKGVYGIDWTGLGTAYNARVKYPWPKRFLFAGRYELIKGLDTLLEAYELYSKTTDDPWELHLCGLGSMRPRIPKCPNVTDHGFLQPHEVRDLMQSCGTLILPSREDPWPLVLVEAAAAGLPLIASHECGSSVEVLRNNYNGLQFASSGGSESLVQAMNQISSRLDLSQWSERSRELAEPYAAEHWANHWQTLFKTVTKQSVFTIT